MEITLAPRIRVFSEMTDRTFPVPNEGNPFMLYASSFVAPISALVKKAIGGTDSIAPIPLIALAGPLYMVTAGYSACDGTHYGVSSFMPASTLSDTSDGFMDVVDFLNAVGVSEAVGVHDEVKKWPDIYGLAIVRNDEFHSGTHASATAHVTTTVPIFHYSHVFSRAQYALTRKKREYVAG